MEAIKVMLDHGGVGLLLIGVSAMALVVVGGERLISLYMRLSHDTRASMEAIRGHILAKRYSDALQVCNARPSAPDLGVVKSAILSVENGREAMQSSLGGALLDLNHRAELRLSYIALIANVATLLGLLGTITGLIKTFAAIANADAAEKAKLLGLGISEAMYSTAFGLSVGIAAMVVHTICTSKADAIVSQAQSVGYQTITWVEQSERVKANG